MGWATFWAIFSQTHLVTLLPGEDVEMQKSHLFKKTRMNDKFRRRKIVDRFVDQFFKFETKFKL
jgi:hypothetical protein